ncbi:MAG: hypothetical protein IJL05_04705 [Alphaproteobacteria bacterium]|nr:hypothetical protein [Alphaproteobacteria bacterium]
MPKQKNKPINLILKDGFWYSKKLNVCLDDEFFITLYKNKKNKIEPKWMVLNIKIGGKELGSSILYGNYNIWNLENVRDIEIAKIVITGETKCFVVYKNGQKQELINTTNYSLLILILLFTLLSWL